MRKTMSNIIDIQKSNFLKNDFGGKKCVKNNFLNIYILIPAASQSNCLFDKEHYMISLISSKVQDWEGYCWSNDKRRGELF